LFARTVRSTFRGDFFSLTNHIAKICFSRRAKKIAKWRTGLRFTDEKVKSLIQACQNLLDNRSSSIREVARIIWKMVPSFPGRSYGPLYYRYWESEKTSALKHNKGDFDVSMTLSTLEAELNWWIGNIANEQNYISRDPQTLQITTDASLSGWGAEYRGISTGGEWTFAEAKLFNTSTIWSYLRHF
jgi:hypothetical protein